MMVAAGRTGESTDAWLRQLVQDAELNNIYQQGLRDYEILSQADRSRFDMLILQFLKAIETAWAQQDLGVLNDDQWYGYEASIRQVVGSPGGMIVLDKRTDAFSPNFIEMVQQVLAGGQTDA